MLALLGFPILWWGYLVNCVLESAYYFTNLVSAKSFIVVLNAKSLSLDAIEFEESMRAARLDSKVSQVEALRAQTGHGPPTRMRCMETNIDEKYRWQIKLSNMEAEPGELTVEDVERFPSLYKDVVTKYTHLCFGISLYNQNRTISSWDEILFLLEGQLQTIQEENEVHKFVSGAPNEVEASGATKVGENFWKAQA